MGNDGQDGQVTAAARRRSLLVAAVVLMGACSSDDTARPSASEITAAPVSSAPPPSAAPPTAAPGTTDEGTTVPASTAALSDDRAAVAALDDVVAWLADPATIDSDGLTEEFLAELAVEDLAAILREIGPGPWEVVERHSVGDDALIARLEGGVAPLLVELAVDSEGRIAGLLFRPAELIDPPTTLDALTQRLAATAPIAGFFRADVGADGTCTPVAELAADVTMPIGSVFKLYVLGALAGQVAAGELTWEQPVVIRDELDSLPSGTTQDEPAGTELSVRELAQRMIEISDNTATDHLIDLVGREAVEAQLTVFGHTNVAAAVPFLTTREASTIKADPDLLERYAAADEPGRRQLLENDVAAAPLPTVEEFPTGPAGPTTVEWFASPTDICLALVALDDLAAQPGLEPIRDIFGANPGVAVEPGTFSSILFKGGSETGVLFGAWLATRPDGSRIVVAGGVADEQAPIDPTTLELLALGLTLE